MEELELGDDFGDLDEPMMAGSNDEFSDCDLDENENDKDEENTDMLTSSSPQPDTSGASSWLLSSQNSYAHANNEKMSWVNRARYADGALCFLCI